MNSSVTDRNLSDELEIDDSYEKCVKKLKNEDFSREDSLLYDEEDSKRSPAEVKSLRTMKIKGKEEIGLARWMVEDWLRMEKGRMIKAAKER